MTEFCRPRSVAEAIEHLGRERAVALAGGTQVAVLMTHGLLEVERLVWLGRIRELRHISVEAGRLAIGAGATLREIASSGEVRSLHPALAAVAGSIGNPRVRAAATLGGHLAHADPRQDLPPLLMVLDAVALVAGPAGVRRVPLGEFFTGFMSTSLEPGELLTGIELPAPAEGLRADYVRFAPNSASDYAAVGVACALVVDAGEVLGAKVALGAGASFPRFIGAAGGALVGRPGEADVADASRAVELAADPVDDQRGSASYKRAMAGLWTRRLVQTLLG